MAAGCDLETSSAIPIRRACCSTSLSPNALHMIRGIGASTVSARGPHQDNSLRAFHTGIERSSTIKSGFEFSSLRNRLFFVLCFSAEFEVQFVREWVTERLTNISVVIHDLR